MLIFSLVVCHFDTMKLTTILARRAEKWWRIPPNHSDKCRITLLL